MVPSWGSLQAARLGPQACGGVTPEARGGDGGEFWSLPGSWVKHPTVRVPGAAAPVAKVTWDDRVLLSVSLTGGGASAPARAGGVCGSPGLSPQWTLTVSEQIQKPRALLLALQLPVLQVVRLLLQVAVPLLLPLLLPLQVQVSGAPLLRVRAGSSLLALTLPSPRPAGAAPAPAPPEAAPAPAPAPGPSPTPQEGGTGRGPGAPPRRKISVLTVQCPLVALEPSDALL